MRAEPGLIAAALAAALLAQPGAAGAGELLPVPVSVREGPALAPIPAVLRRDVRAFGPSAPPVREIPVEPDGSPSLIAQQSIGCLIVGSGMTGLAMLAGSENLVNIVGGGLVRAANPQVLALGVLGVTFGTFCAVGGALTPLYLHLTRDPEPAAPPPPDPPAFLAQPDGIRRRG